jgi:hypothetical protein
MGRGGGDMLAGCALVGTASTDAAGAGGAGGVRSPAGVTDRSGVTSLEASPGTPLADKRNKAEGNTAGC